MLCIHSTQEHQSVFSRNVTNKEAAKEFPFCQEFFFFTSLEDSSIDKREMRPLGSLRGGPGPQSKALRIQHKHLSSSSREETNSSSVAVTVKNT